MVKCPECNWETENLYRETNTKKKGICANCMAEEMLFKGVIEKIEDN